MQRHLALVMNCVLPGSGLLLRHPGLWLGLPVLMGAAGLSLIAVAVGTSGSAATIPFGWGGLILWLVAVLGATVAWALLERPSSRDLTAIQPLFRQIAAFYLTDQLPAAEQAAHKLVALAGAEPGAWRLLALITRAQGKAERAAKFERRAARLELSRT